MRRLDSIAAVLFTLIGTVGAFGQTFHVITPPPGFSDVMPTGISENGTVVVGHYFDVRRAFRWTPTGGMVTLVPPAPNTLAYAQGVSLDGSVIVGHTSQENLITTRGMRWTQAGGMVAFGPALNEQFMGIEGVNGSGQTVFGTLGQGSIHAGFTWNLSQPNPVYLPILPGGFEGRVVAMASNPVHSTVGNVYFSPSPDPIYTRPVLWENNVLQALPTVWGGSNAVTCISEDGAIMYGYNKLDPTFTQPIGWRREGSTIVNFWYLPFTYIGGRRHAPITACTAAGTLHDGSVIFGKQYLDEVFDDIAYMFGYASGGTHDLNVWLPAVGITIPPGMTLRDVRAVSNDGTAICGRARTSTGTIGYVVRGIPCLNRPVMPIYANFYESCTGHEVSMTVATEFPYVGNVSYQWYKDEQLLSDGLAPGGAVRFGTQSSTLLIQDATQFDSGQYVCLAYNACGESYSGPQTLSVIGYPLAAAPEPPVVCPGGTVSISMNTSNVTSCLWEYHTSFLDQWVPFSNGPLTDFGAGVFTNVSGATTDTLTLSNTSLGAPLAIRFSGGNICQIMAPIQTVLDYPTPPVISSDPSTTNYCYGQPASFTVGASSQLPLTYQWQLYHFALLQWINLSDGFYIGGATGLSGTIAGSTTPTLTFTLATVGTVAPDQPFRCVVSHGCGSATSLPANLHICIADADCDGFVNSQDFFYFLTAYFNSDPLADVNADSLVNSQDFFHFLTAYFNGC